MAKRKFVWNEDVYRRRVSEGRGQGEKSQYLPWIRVQDFASSGTISRISGSKTGRIHHFMSSGEKDFFYLLEWSDEVIDIREQFPLHDLERATSIASEAGIRYPRDPVSGFPYVLTCDFMIQTQNGLKARTVKRSNELRKKRTIEKLEIERRYWHSLDIDWRLVTEYEIPIIKVRNIEWLHSSFRFSGRQDLALITDAVRKYFDEKNNSILATARWIDQRFEFPDGSGLQIVKHLLWKKIITCNIDDRFLTISCTI